eukprot:scaffold1618_cov397-Prasinococcus_capsulatus_cf.AAC.20
MKVRRHYAQPAEDHEGCSMDDDSSTRVPSRTSVSTRRREAAGTSKWRQGPQPRPLRRRTEDRARMRSPLLLTEFAPWVSICRAAARRCSTSFLSAARWRLVDARS